MTDVKYSAADGTNKIKNTNKPDKRPNISGKRARCVVTPRYVEPVVLAEAAPQTQQIVINTLSPEDQRLLWEGIKRHNPSLANVMSGNELVKEMKAVFSADWVMDRAEVDRYLGKGE